jgi:hypothetical protein
MNDQKVLELRPILISRDEALISLSLDEKTVGLISIKRLKRKIKARLKFIDEERIYPLDCRIDEEIDLACLNDLAEKIDERFPGAGEQIKEGLLKVLRDWQELIVYQQLKEYEELIRRDQQPFLEIISERGVAKIFPNEDAIIDLHGGFLDLGDCLIVGESAPAFTRFISVEKEYERIDLIGFAVAYCRDERGYSMREIKWFTANDSKIRIANRTIRVKASQHRFLAASPSFFETFPKLDVLKAVAERKSVDIEWDHVGDDIVKRLMSYIVFHDDRLYDVVASYVAMTYFFDFFTAIPFLFFHGPAGSGKTRANMTATYLSRHGIFISDPSEAILYRLVEATGATLGIDESVLSERAKRILASGYKKGSFVPRADPSGRDIVIRLFEVTAPRIFSFKFPPSDDFLLQRMILINMLKSRPSEVEDPTPYEFKDLKESLYLLRLTKPHEIIDHKKRSFNELLSHNLWGRELEIWAPLYTAALLMKRNKEVLNYILEDVATRRENELIYSEEKVVLSAIEELFNKSPHAHIVGSQKVVRFMAKDLKPIILNQLLESEDCIKITDDRFETRQPAFDDPRCVRFYNDIDAKWLEQRIGIILHNLGFGKFKRSRGKGKWARKVYELPWNEFVRIAERYDYIPSQGEGDASGET